MPQPFLLLVLTMFSEYRLSSFPKVFFSVLFTKANFGRMTHVCKNLFITFRDFKL